MRSKENLVLIEPHEGILIAYSLYYREELRGIEDIPERDAVMSKTVDPTTLEMAKQLILNLPASGMPPNTTMNITKSSRA